MVTIKALVLAEQGHRSFLPLWLLKTKFASSRTKSGQKSDKEIFPFFFFSVFVPREERQTLPGLTLAKHTKLQNLPKYLASNDAEDPLCSLFLYFLSCPPPPSSFVCVSCVHF